MGLLALAAAQLNFTHIDHIWHIYTPKDLKLRANEGAIMHAPPEGGIHLIHVPFVPWGEYFPDLTQLPSISTDSPHAIHITELDHQEHEHCTRVITALTESQRKTLKAFAKGLNRQQAANELGLSLKTIDTNKTAIYKKCIEEWELPIDQYIDYHFLKEKFSRYFDNEEYTSLQKKAHQKRL
jgi:CRISPR-associated protein Csx14